MAIGSVNLLEVLVYTGMCLSSIGVCAVYVVFILQTFPAVVPAATPEYMALVRVVLRSLGARGNDVLAPPPLPRSCVGHPGHLAVSNTVLKCNEAYCCDCMMSCCGVVL